MKTGRITKKKEPRKINRNQWGNSFQRVKVATMIPVWNESRDQQTKALAKSDNDFSRRRWGQLLDWYDNITVSRIVVVKKKSLY